jgi:hypothetical protein
MHLVHAQWLANGNGMPHAALRFVGGYYYKFSEVSYGVYQVADARCSNTVVIGYQYNRLVCLFVHISLYKIAGFAGFEKIKAGEKTKIIFDVRKILVLLH